MKKLMLLLPLVFGVGCANYQYASKVKMVSFDGNLEAGQNAGQITGKDCTWKVMGYDLGGKPTVDKAFMNARDQADELQSAGFGDLGKKNSNQRLRYVTNVSTKTEGFNAYVVGKNCLVVTGVGHK